MLTSPSDLGRFTLETGCHPAIDSDTLRFRPCLALVTEVSWDMLAGNDRRLSPSWANCTVLDVSRRGLYF